MILINLLPEDLRIKEVRKIAIPYREIAVGVFALFLIATLFNLFVYVRVRGEFRSLDKQWKELAPGNTEAESLEKELGATIVAEVDFYDQFVDPPLEAARVMNLMSDLIPASIWLDQMKFERKKRDIQLILMGFSESRGKSSTLVEIQKFANDLKARLEANIGPASNTNLNAKKHVKATVTTSSQTAGTDQSEVIQFTATLKSDGFDQK